MARRYPSHAELEAGRAELETLRTLSGREQADIALGILVASRSQTFLAAAGEHLAGNADPRLLLRMRALYRELEANGGRNDRGAISRVAILKWMKGKATTEDLDLLTDAIGRREAAGMNESLANLWTAALVTLDGVAPELSVWHAARFASWLDSPSTPVDGGSGEPVVTAVRVLAANGQGPLLLVLLERGSNPSAEAEALRQLVDVDLQFIEDQVQSALRLGDPQLTAAYDLLLGHVDLGGAVPIIAAALRSAPDADAYAYLAASIVAGRRPEHLATFYEAAKLEQRGDHMRAAVEALEFDSSATGRELSALLRERLARQ